MSKPWKILSLAAAVVALMVCLMPGGSVRPTPASAEDCTQDNTGTLVIEITDHATNDLLSFGGARVLIDPDPSDFELDHIVVDSDVTDANAAEDRDSDRGVIRLEGVCSTEGSERYEASLYSLPGDLEDCDVVVSSDSGTVSPGGTRTLTLEVDCTGIVATPTPAATATPAAPSTVITNTSPLTVSCNGTSVVNITVRDAAGHAVKAGTPVTITTTLGAISPTSGHVTNDQGSVFAFLTAPATTGGIATVTATAGAASGSATVTVNCGAAAPTATTAPPPAATAGTTGTGVITPPNTGDAGLAARGGGSSVLVVLGFAVASLVLAAMTRVRRT